MPCTWEAVRLFAIMGQSTISDRFCPLTLSCLQAMDKLGLNMAVSRIATTMEECMKVGGWGTRATSVHRLQVQHASHDRAKGCPGSLQR